MSKYTTELRFICEEKAGYSNSQDGDNVELVINKSVNKIFDFEYPIFNEGYRNVLNKKILNHFYFREIGYETYGLWHNRLRVKMNEIMPYYNKLYESETLQHDPFTNYDITKIHDGEFEKARKLDRTGSDIDRYTGSDSDIYSGTETLTNTGSDWEKHTGSDTETKTGTDTDTHSGTDSRAIDTLNSDGDKWTLFSDTPQGGLDGIQNATDDVKSNAYLTNATREITSFSDSKTDDLTHGEVVETEYDTETTNTHGENIELKHGKVAENEFDKTIEHERNTSVEREKGTTDNENENGTDNYNDRIFGYRDIDPNKMLKEWRNNLLNIDMMIIDELDDLFLKLW